MNEKFESVHSVYDDDDNQIFDNYDNIDIN